MDVKTLREYKRHPWVFKHFGREVIPPLEQKRRDNDIKQLGQVEAHVWQPNALVSFAERDSVECGFETKKAEIMDNSALELNRYFNEIAHWNEDAIRNEVRDSSFLYETFGHIP